MISPVLCLLRLSVGCSMVLLVACQTTKDTRHRIVVSAADQRMAVFEDEKPIGFFRVSTSKFGLGSQPGSNRTPTGQLEIAEKIGGGQRSGMKFSSRVPTGEIVRPNSPGRDPIVTRILWLKGLERQNANTHSRTVYIHGTPEEWRLGTPASYGCVRMSSRDVIWLYDHVGEGAKVQIFPTPLRYHLK